MSAGTEGVQLTVPPELRDEFLWQALKIKVLHPDQFLPVTDVKVLLPQRHDFCPALPLSLLPLRVSFGRRARATMARARTGR
jgi:hypothetical protein